ncbi:replicative DNA helicase [uncultured Paraglaciecola sp.]|uniref:replicative DNA helicase n=1 Tax=uncultured Paraglaciecola sp. TaxID=1765024 RepID=UPI002610E467|nr:replicative DNA helicase [uncultured Paraglaciecola sp.]
MLIDNERAVLAIALAYPDTIDQSGLTFRDFSDPSHRSIWQAMVDLFADGLPVESVPVIERAMTIDPNTEIYVMGEIAVTPAALSSLSHYSRKVSDAAKERKLLGIANEIAQIARSDSGVDEKYAKAESLLIHSDQQTPTVEQINPAIAEALTELDNRFNSDGLAGLTTGLTALDKRTNGLCGSQLTLLAARPAMGKTALALNIATHVACSLNKPALVFSLEMARSELMERVFSSRSSVDYGAIRSGKLKNEQWTALSGGVQSLKDKPLYIYDKAGVTLNQLRSLARASHRKNGIELIVIDYLQLIRLEGRSKNEEVGEISRSLKELSKELDIPILCLSQLNRSCEDRPDKRPRLSDLRDSGSLEQDSDTVIFIYRDEIYNEDSEERGIAELITRKQRAGLTGTDRIQSRLDLQRFEDLSHDYTPPLREVYKYAG